MYKWLFKFLCLAGGLLVGFVTAYALVSFKVAATSPFALNLSKHTEPTDRVFAEMVRLGEAEAVFRGCGTGATSTNLNPSAREILLQNEAALINPAALSTLPPLKSYG